MNNSLWRRSLRTGEAKHGREMVTVDQVLRKLQFRIVRSHNILRSGRIKQALTCQVFYRVTGVREYVTVYMLITFYSGNPSRLVTASNTPRPNWLMSPDPLG